MRPENLELFCANLECGETVVHTGAFSHAATKKHRPLQYIGTLQLSSGVVHQYMCPVCSTKRIFGNEDSGFKELPYEATSRLENVAAILELMDETMGSHREEKRRQDKNKSWIRRLKDWPYV